MKIENVWGAFLSFFRKIGSLLATGQRHLYTARDSRLNRLRGFYITVTHPSTNHAQHCLTSVIGWQLVFSTRHGRILINNFEEL
jgi:hypothetical protein